MSLLNDASLVMIPSGYKDTKLYSVKPTNGDGDFTFSRGSNLAATRVNSEGLIEKGRENTTTYSQDATQWTDVNLARTSVTESDPFNGSDAAEYEVSSISGAAYFYRTTSPSILSGQVITGSVYVKDVDQRYIQLLLGSAAFGSGHYQNFDLQTGTKGTSANIIDSSIESVGNGWYRLSITKQATANGSSGLVCGFVPSASALRLQAPSTLGRSLQAFGFQTELGLVATDYIETTTTTAQAGILEDMPRLDYSGGASCPSLLLEPQRSNLITNSEYFGVYSKSPNLTLTHNYGISPEGLENSTRMQVPDSSNYYILSNSISATAGTYVISVYAKGTSGEKFQLYSDGSAGGGGFTSCTLTGDWQRFERVVTTTGTGTLNPHILFGYGVSPNAQDIEVWGFQCEEASYPTSYIPTYGSSVTRSVEYYVKESASALIGQTEGVLFVDFVFNTDEAVSKWVAFLGEGVEYIGIYVVGGTNKIRLETYDNAVTSGFNSTSAIVKGQRYKCAIAYANNDFTAYINGVQLGTDSSGSVPTTNKISSAYNTTSVEGLKTNQLLVFKTRLTNDELAELTTL